MCCRWEYICQKHNYQNILRLRLQISIYCDDFRFIDAGFNRRLFHSNRMRRTIRCVGDETGYLCVFHSRSLCVDSFNSKIKVQYGVCLAREIQYNYPESSAGWFNAPSSHVTPDFWWDIQTAAERRRVIFPLICVRCILVPALLSSCFTLSCKFI